MSLPRSEPRTAPAGPGRSALPCAPAGPGPGSGADPAVPVPAEKPPAGSCTGRGGGGRRCPEPVRVTGSQSRGLPPPAAGSRGRARALLPGAGSGARTHRRHGGSESPVLPPARGSASSALRGDSRAAEAAPGGLRCRRVPRVQRPGLLWPW